MLHIPATDIAIAEPVTELEVRGAAEAAALIGTDVQKGLAEVRRLHATAMACYAASNRMLQASKDACAGDFDKLLVLEKTPAYLAAEAASEEAGYHHHYALMHMLRLPVQSIDDIRDKTAFAIEQADYTDDEDIPQTILKQILAFYAGGVTTSAVVSTPALQGLSSEWGACLAEQDRLEKACIAATEAHDDRAYDESDEQHTELVRKECEIAEKMLLVPALTLADLRIKAAVSIRETVSSQLTRYVDNIDGIEELVKGQNLDLGSRASASLALDVMRLAAISLPPQTFLQAAE